MNRRDRGQHPGGRIPSPTSSPRGDWPRHRAVAARRGTRSIASLRPVTPQGEATSSRPAEGRQRSRGCSAPPNPYCARRTRTIRSRKRAAAGARRIKVSPPHAGRCCAAPSEPALWREAAMPGCGPRQRRRRRLRQSRLRQSMPMPAPAYICPIRSTG
jgi:hypothetical protein